MYYINTKTAPVHALWSSVVLFLRLKLAQRGADNWQSNIRKRNVHCASCSLTFIFYSEQKEMNIVSRSCSSVWSLILETWLTYLTWTLSFLCTCTFMLLGAVFGKEDIDPKPNMISSDKK